MTTLKIIVIRCDGCRANAGHVFEHEGLAAALAKVRELGWTRTNRRGDRCPNCQPRSGPPELCGIGGCVYLPHQLGPHSHQTTAAGRTPAPTKGTHNGRNTRTA